MLSALGLPLVVLVIQGIGLGSGTGELCPTLSFIVVGLVLSFKS